MQFNLQLQFLFSNYFFFGHSTATNANFVESNVTAKVKQLLKVVGKCSIRLFQIVRRMWRTSRSTFNVPILRRWSLPQFDRRQSMWAQRYENCILSHQMINISDYNFVISLLAERQPATQSTRVECVRMREQSTEQCLQHSYSMFFLPLRSIHTQRKCLKLLAKMDILAHSNQTCSMRIFFSYFIIIHLHYRILCKSRERTKLLSWAYDADDSEEEKKKYWKKTTTTRNGFFLFLIHSSQKFSSFIRWLNFVYIFFFHFSRSRSTRRMRQPVNLTYAHISYTDTCR